MILLPQNKNFSLHRTTKYMRFRKFHSKDNTNYQFGMQLNPEWTKQEILPLNLKKTPNGVFFLIQSITPSIVQFLLY